MLTFEEINDRTGFANGIKFQDQQAVREYFTVESMLNMVTDPDDLHPDCLDQTKLDEMAATVWVEGWHVDTK